MVYASFGVSMFPDAFQKVTASGVVAFKSVLSAFWCAARAVFIAPSLEGIRYTAALFAFFVHSAHRAFNL